MVLKPILDLLIGFPHRPRLRLIGCVLEIVWSGGFSPTLPRDMACVENSAFIVARP